MKSLLRIFPLLLFLLLSPYTSAGEITLNPVYPDQGLYGWVVPVPRYDETPDLPPTGDRAPSVRRPFEVTAYGVTISGVDSRDILLYEILDLQDMPVATFHNGISFAETLFSLTGEYQVRFQTDNYVYMGWVEV